MKTVGILYHPNKEDGQLLAAEIESWLAEQGIVGLVAPDRDGALADNVVVQNMAGLSLLIVLGGDGSTLRAAHHASPFGVPIFAVNLGRVGFMSEAEPEDWREKLSLVISGEWWPEERLMLHARLERGGECVTQMAALNDVVIGRGGQARVVRLRLYVDNDYVTTYTADGLIVATPTGSTAYAMAAGGPLLWPRLPNFLVIPVAPHLSLDRAVVLHQTAVVSIEAETELEAALTIDGQGAFPILSGDRVIIRQNDKSCTFARVGKASYFYHRLMQRFGYWHPR
jgi:NAD+ kinase